MQMNDSELLVTLEITYKFILVSRDNGAKMSPKRRTLLSLVFACIYLSESLLIRIQIWLLNAWYAGNLLIC